MTRAISMLHDKTLITFPGDITIISSNPGFPRINFNSDGSITYTSNGIAGLYYAYGWYRTATFGNLHTGVGAAYEIKLTPTSGSFGLELTSTWVPLTSGTSWDRSSGNGTSTGTIEIREASTDLVKGRCTISLMDL